MLILVPRTSFVAALLLTAYFGGATATHVRVADPFFFPILLGVFLWVGIGLRMPEVFALALGTSRPVAFESPEGTPARRIPSEGGEKA